MTEGPDEAPRRERTADVAPDRSLGEGLTKLSIGAFGKPVGIDLPDEEAENSAGDGRQKGSRPKERPKERPGEQPEVPTTPSETRDDTPAATPELEPPTAEPRVATPPATTKPPRKRASKPAPPTSVEPPEPADLPTPYASRASHVPARPEPDSRLGHRERLRHRLREAGPTALAEYELLEMVLFRAIPRQDTKPLAKRLLKRFGSLADVFNAPDNLLREVAGVGEAVVNEFRLMAAIGDAVLRARVLDRPVLSSWEAVLDYVRAHIGFRDVEHFHVLFLDKRNKLIRDEIQQKGTVDHTPVYPREIVRRALELNATALIMVHNHPSGDPAPSRADVTMTKTVIDIATPMGVVVHDHIVVGREGHASLKGMGLI